MLLRPARRKGDEAKYREVNRTSNSQSAQDSPFRHEKVSGCQRSGRSSPRVHRVEPVNVAEKVLLVGAEVPRQNRQRAPHKRGRSGDHRSSQKETDRQESARPKMKCMISAHVNPSREGK